MSRHLVISDLHENSSALIHFIRIAERFPGSFDDIWLPGDLFGHSDDATGADDLTQSVLDTYRIIEKYHGIAVKGNWEHWLTHPERDTRNTYQAKYTEQLAQRRDLFKQKNNRSLLDRTARETVHIFPDGFTMFHGCSYPCHGNSDYQPHPCECYLFPRDLNIVTRGLFGSRDHLQTPHFLFGHTHIPGFFTYSVTTMKNMWRFFTLDMQNQPIPYGDPALRFGINPGSAGIRTQRVPRTALLLDTTRKTFTYLADTEA